MAAERPSCKFLFAQSCLLGKELQDEVFRNYPKGQCELEPISEFSPGPVEDQETLTRLIVHPIHFYEGRVSPMAFVDATTVDLSVFREEAATDDELQLSIDEVKKTGAGKIPPQERAVHLIMQASAAKIREAHFDEGARMCFIYDTATPSKPAHASVFTPSDARKGAKQRAVRRKLLELFSERTSEPEDYRAHLEY